MLSAIGPAEPWFCKCQEWGYGPGLEKRWSAVLRTATVVKCPVCKMVAPWAEEKPDA